MRFAKILRFSSRRADIAIDLYNVRQWGAGFFDVNEKGQVIVSPKGPAGPTRTALANVESRPVAAASIEPVAAHHGVEIAMPIARMLRPKGSSAVDDELLGRSRRPARPPRTAMT